MNLFTRLFRKNNTICSCGRGFILGQTGTIIMGRAICNICCQLQADDESGLTFDRWIYPLIFGDKVAKLALKDRILREENKKNVTR